MFADYDEVRDSSKIWRRSSETARSIYCSDLSPLCLFAPVIYVFGISTERQIRCLFIYYNVLLNKSSLRFFDQHFWPLFLIYWYKLIQYPGVSFNQLYSFFRTTDLPNLMDLPWVSRISHQSHGLTADSCILTVTCSQAKFCSASSDFPIPGCIDCKKSQYFCDNIFVSTFCEGIVTNEILIKQDRSTHFAPIETKIAYVRCESGNFRI